MHKVAVMGDRDSVYGFAALGLEVYPLEEAKEAVKILGLLSGSNVAVVYITEALAAKIEPEIESYRLQKLPAIILIPGVSGNTGKGMLNVKKSVEQAVGSDIIFDKNN